MPVLNEDSNTEKNERLIRNCVRIQNLPWTSCTSDIKQFFNGLSIKQGGVLVRNFEAFVSFENICEAHIALQRRNILLHGYKLELSLINEVELWKFLFKTVRRKLDFESMIKRDAKFYSEDPPRRKIRPTPVVKGFKQRSVSCSTFLPIEIDPLSFSSSETDCSFTEMSPCGKRSVRGMRRLHPTSITSTMQTDKLAVFHPEEYYQAKKIRLDE